MPMAMDVMILMSALKVQIAALKTVTTLLAVIRALATLATD